MSIRCGGLVSAAPCSRRFTTPRAWNVCTTGMPSGRAAAQPASPDIQKWVWTRSGGEWRQAWFSHRAKSVM